MYTISKETLQALRDKYTKGSRVELLHMDDPYNTKLVPGSKGLSNCNQKHAPSFGSSPNG